MAPNSSRNKSLLASTGTYSTMQVIPIQNLREAVGFPEGEVKISPAVVGVNGNTAPIQQV